MIHACDAYFLCLETTLARHAIYVDTLTPQLLSPATIASRSPGVTVVVSWMHGFADSRIGRRYGSPRVVAMSIGGSGYSDMWEVGVDGVVCSQGGTLKQTFRIEVQWFYCQ